MKQQPKPKKKKEPPYNIKPVKLDMPFDEAMKRLIRVVPKKKK